MNKEQAVFFLAGILFGLVCGYIVAYQLHRPSPAVAATSTGPTHSAGESPGAPVGGAQGEMLMQQVTARIGELRARVEADPRDLEALADLGNMYSEAGKFAEAIDFYRRALEVEPENPDLLSALGVAHRNSGDPRSAIELFRRATRARPEHWQSWLDIAIVSMFDLNDLAAAEEALTRVEALQPGLPNLKQLRDHLQHLREDAAPAAR